MAGSRITSFAGLMCLVFACGTIVAGGGCTFGSDVDGTGAVAPAGQAVGTGTTDTSNSYNFVGAIQSPGQTAPYCTGVLLTPVWVALANHCITGSDEGAFACLGIGTPTYEPGTGIGTGGALEVTFDYNPMAIGTNLFTPQSLTPRFAAVPPHAVRMNSPVNWCLDSQRKKDLALVKLSARVPSTIAVPQHPPGVLGTPECPGGGDEFYGRLVGYGHKTLWFGSEDQNRKRNYASAVEYEYDDQLYKNTWMVPPWALFDSSWYTGGLGGDSGAPLFEVSSGQVCGLHVAHKVFFDIEWVGGFFPVVLLVAESNAVALDFDDNQSFVKARVVDSRGQFMGECGSTADPSAPPALLDLDTDGDYLPDACDPCPEVPDNQYRGTGVLSAQMTPMGANDADKDGIPDLCDLCPQHGKALGDGRQLIGGVWRQPDADGDGLANACDSDCPANANVSDLTCCNPSNPGTTCDPAGSLLPWSNRCFAIAPQTAAMASIACPTLGRCGKPLDSDQDGTPETCDNCPGESNGKQDDTDGDGVGDACDNCPGKHAFGPQLADAAHPSCVPGDPVDGDPACAALAPGGRCAFVPPNGGRCTKQADADGDGRGDGCDSCRLVQNPLQKNCNLEIERTLNVPYPFIGDACDRTPCARLFESAGYIESGNDSGNMWAAASYNPVLLPEGKVGPLPENTAFTYGAKPLADVGGRHCDCSLLEGLTGKQLPDAWKCRSRCPLNSGLYSVPPSEVNPWFPTSLSATGKLPPPVPPLPALLSNLGMQRPFELTSEAPVAELPDDAPAYFSWSLTADGAKNFAGL
ncbi:MAG: thrombospondin type 3 repeat-containing protein, partial [Polyangiaceae bacterium]|nr:thrombospondin type 3 repeat-containing protein [Polyangiaceae bacterium]